MREELSKPLREDSASQLMSLDSWTSSPLHSLRKSKLFQRLLRTSLNRPRLCDLKRGFPIAIRPLTHASLRWKTSKIEPEMSELFDRLVRSLFQKSSVVRFFDVGANVGWYAWLALQAYPNSEITLFEPDPENLELLRLTVSHSGLDQVTIRETALSDRRGSAFFHQDCLTSATGMIRSGETPWVERYLGSPTSLIRIERNKLDSFCSGGDYPNLLKIDVEGHEREVLKGAVTCLSRGRPLLLVESFPPRREEVIKLLSQNGYRIMDAESLDPIGPGTTNLFAWHPSGPLATDEIPLTAR